jgi:hypothetical protein
MFGLLFPYSTLPLLKNFSSAMACSADLFWQIRESRPRGVFLPIPLNSKTVAVSKIEGAGRTVMNTAGLQTPIDPFHAEVAGAGNSFFGIILGSPERAGFQAGFAPGAQRPIEEDDPIGPLGDGTHRARLHAGRFTAMAAAGGREAHP